MAVDCLRHERGGFGEGVDESKLHEARFQHYDAVDGLPSNGVIDIAEDARGHLWLATWNGVARFDGRGFIGFDRSTGLSARTLNWSFQVESAAPKVLFVVGNTAVNGSEAQIKARLESKGFEVQAGDDDAALPSNVNFKQLIIVCSTSGSGNITKYRDVPVPIINWEWAAYDGLAMSDADGQALSTENQNKIINASHPLAAGLSGTVTLFPAPPRRWPS